MMTRSPLIRRLPLKAALAAACMAVLTGAWEAKGLDGISTEQAERKEVSVIFEGSGMRHCDLYDGAAIKPGLFEELHASKKARLPDDLFRTALSDSAIVRDSNGNPWLIRVFYAPGDLSPWKNTVWIGKLRREESSQRPSIFTISEVVPVKIPNGMASLMEPFRATEAMLSERKSQLECMLQDLDQAVRNLDGVEEMIRGKAEGVREHGTCCSEERNGKESNEEIARKLERDADDARSWMARATDTRDKLRPVILRQLSTTSGNIRGWESMDRE